MSHLSFIDIVLCPKPVLFLSLYAPCVLWHIAL